MPRTYKVVGLGEILWDVFPEGRQLGGAPANFAYITTLLGDEGIPASRLGDDDLGREARAQIVRLGVSDAYIQTDARNPTGTVKVTVDRNGQPHFEFTERVAWDFLEWIPSWQALAQAADAVCFGSLAQRASDSGATILEFLQATRPEALRVFDVNLRQKFFSREILDGSLRVASIVKLNHEELPRICELFKISANDEHSSARQLASLHDIQMVCVTRGARGSLIVKRNGEVSEHPGFQVRIADTVGAGDAFTAAMVHEYLRGASVDRINEAANRMGAWVASQVGATPVPAHDNISEALASIT